MLVPESIVLGAWGLLSFIALIVYLRWAGTLKDQNKDEAPTVNVKQEALDQSVVSARRRRQRQRRTAATLERAMARSKREAKSSADWQPTATTLLRGLSKERALMADASALRFSRIAVDRLQTAATK